MFSRFFRSHIFVGEMNKAVVLLNKTLKRKNAQFDNTFQFSSEFASNFAKIGPLARLTKFC